MPSLIPNVESGKFSTSKKKILFQNHMNWDILQSWKIFYFYWKISTLVKIFSLFWTSKRAQIQSKWRNWKIFHFGGKFSTSKNLQKKNFFCRIAWIGTFCRGRKFSTFGGKFSTLLKFYFRHLDLRVCQISSQKEKLEFFQLWWKIFHLQKCAPKKKFFLQNCMNWNILQRWKIFQFWWKIFHFGEILFSVSRPSRLPNFIPNWEIGNFSTLVVNFPLSKICKKKKIFFAELHELEHSAEGTFFRKIGNFSTFPIFSKIPKIYFFGPTSVPSFRKIEETFFTSSSSSFIIIIIIMTTRCARGCAG